MEFSDALIDNNDLARTMIESRSVANYKIAQLIGAGGMANIYKAIQLSLDRPVALKIMHKHLTVNEGFIQRFEKEAKQAAMLHHENIVSIIDFGHNDGEYFIAMEYIDGKNLRQISEIQKRLPLEICLLICQQVAEGLKYAHSHNLVHRDIKPANIILSNDGRVLITDFGIAKGNDDLSITTTGQMVGSPAYMSPEQAAGRHLDSRSDLFSLGIILYEIITGEKPFKGETYQEMITSIMSQQPDPMQPQRVDVTPELEKIMEKALLKDVDRRFQNAEEFSAALSEQLNRFRLPPVKSLISNYIKNPIKITEKLREDKISNHLEAALYFMNLGEGKLAEAQKEFQEVLRFDKNNKSARDFLDRLQNQLEKKSDDDGKRNRLMRKLLYFGISAVAIILCVLSFFMFLRPQKNNENQNIVAGIDNDSIAGQLRNPVPEAIQSRDSTISKSLTGRDFKNMNNAENKNRENQSISNGKPLPSQTETTNGHKQAGSNESKSAPLAAYAENGSNSYPNQSLMDFGMVAIITNIPAKIQIDGIDYGFSNGPPIKLSPGRHYIEISSKGYKMQSRRIFTEKDKLMPLRLDLTLQR
jgi:serine/threonine protein kinase